MDKFEDKREVKINEKVVQTGIQGAVYHLIKTIMVERKVNELTAVREAAKFLDELSADLTRSLKSKTNEDDPNKEKV